MSQVKLFPLDVWGCGHYRMYWPAQAVAETGGSGFDQVQIVQPDERRVSIRFSPYGGVASEAFPVLAGDVVVFQRPTPEFMPEVIRLLQKRGVAVVIDMDDDLASLHPRNLAWFGYHPRTSNGHSWEAAAESCRLADLVTVTTPQLARRYGAHGRVAIIPNMVPADYLTIMHRDSAEIGWAGSVQTHPDDLQQVGPAIARLVNKGVVFRTVGDSTEVAKALGLSKDPLTTGSVPFDRYAASIAEFGIGIAPLAKTRFNEAKSRLKPLEYSAVGVPWVGSPTEDYKAFHGEGCGLLADRPKDWERQLRRLIGDESLRLELSAAGREVARRNTMEGNAWRWIEAWRAAAARVG